MRIDTHPTETLMQKLALKLDDLSVQSFQTTPALRDLRCTVRGHLMEASYDELACSGACGSQIYTCATCDTCDEACDAGGGPDAQRRIIVYGA
jgi:hypothetical protein